MGGILIVLRFMKNHWQAVIVIGLVALYAYQHHRIESLKQDRAELRTQIEKAAASLSEIEKQNRLKDNAIKKSLEERSVRDAKKRKTDEAITGLDDGPVDPDVRDFIKRLYAE